MMDTRALLLETNFPSVRRGQLDVLQVNLGYLRDCDDDRPDPESHPSA